MRNNENKIIFSTVYIQVLYSLLKNKAKLTFFNQFIKIMIQIGVMAKNCKNSLKTSLKVSNLSKFIQNYHFSTQKIVHQKKEYENLNQHENKEIMEQQQKNLPTMEKKYEQVQVKSFQGKSFSNLTELQRKIIVQNKFDLNHPQIKPKLASMNSIPGIQRSQNITQIDLGNIKIKEKNQVFLSQIDPYNIPQDYEIRFDEQKKLTLIGKKVSFNDGKKKEMQQVTNKNSQMPISLSQSFEQKTVGQISQKYMGQIGYKYEFNRKKTFKQLILIIPVIFLLIIPTFTTVDELYECRKSIMEIQQEQMKEIKMIKKLNMVNALLNNKDFNQII